LEAQLKKAAKFKAPRPAGRRDALTPRAGADAAGDPFSSSDDDSQKDDEEAVLERLARPPQGTLDRTGGQSYAKLRIHKLKKLKPWYYEHCYVCGSDEKSDGDLLLCDGQDGRSPASYAIDATLFP